MSAVGEEEAGDPNRHCAMDPLKFGTLEVRLAENEAEIQAAQALRYQVFYEEMMATPSPEMEARRLDFDAYDRICDHLLAIDLERSNGSAAVVGTYRLLRRSVALEHGGFYSAQEYDLTLLNNQPGEIVELGRSCVDPAYRARGVMQMLWRGLASYVHHYSIRLLFGCASFPGTEPNEMVDALAYLHENHLAPPRLRPRALDHHYVEMRRQPPSSLAERDVVSTLPPLIKGYLRLGGFVGDGAVVDYQFNTTDVCMIVKTDQLSEKYDRKYRRSAGLQFGA